MDDGWMDNNNSNDSEPKTFGSIELLSLLWFGSAGFCPENRVLLHVSPESVAPARPPAAN